MRPAGRLPRKRTSATRFSNRWRRISLARRLATVSREPGRDESVHEVTLTADGDQTVIVYENLSVPPDLLWAYGTGEQIHVEDLGAHLAGLERNADEARWEALEPPYRELAAKLG